jgi:Domain of unknown function (DUF4105)
VTQLGRAAVADTARGPDAPDPFAPNDTRFHVGPHAGKEMVLAEQRSAYLLSADELRVFAARYGLQEGELAFANFRHQGHWYVVRVRDGAVEKAILHISHFPMPGPFQIAGHLQIRFKMEAGKEAILVPQVMGDLDASGRPLGCSKLADVVYSAEAVPAHGDEAYSLMKGLQKRFAIAHRMVSIADRQRTMTDTRGNPRWVEQAEMRVSRPEAQALLRNCVLAGTRDGLSRMYHTLRTSCATEVFARLNETLAYGRFHDLRRRVTESCIPVRGFSYLRARGILGKILPSLNAEFPWPRED